VFLCGAEVGADLIIGPFEIQVRPSTVVRDPFHPPPPIGYPPENDAYAEAEAGGAPKDSSFELTAAFSTGEILTGPAAAAVTGDRSSALADASIEAGWTAAPAGPAFGFDMSVLASAEGTTLWDPDGTPHYYRASARAMAGLTGTAAVRVGVSDADALPVFGVYAQPNSRGPDEQVEAVAWSGWSNTLRQWEGDPDMQNHVPGRSPQEPSERDLAVSGDILSLDISAYGASEVASSDGRQTGTLEWSLPDAVTFGLVPLVEGRDYHVRTTLAPEREFYGTQTHPCAFAALGMLLDAWAGPQPALKQSSGQAYAQELAANLPGWSTGEGLSMSEQLQAVSRYVQDRLGANGTPLVPVLVAERGNLPQAAELAGDRGWPMILGSTVYDYTSSGALEDVYKHTVLVTGDLVVRENLAEDDYQRWLAVWDTWLPPVYAITYDPDPGPWDGPVKEHNFTWRGADWWPGQEFGEEELRTWSQPGAPAGWNTAEPIMILYLRPRASCYRIAALDFAYPSLDEWRNDVEDVVLLDGWFGLQSGQLIMHPHSADDVSRLLLTCYVTDEIRLRLEGGITGDGHLGILVEDAGSGRLELLDEICADQMADGLFVGQWSLTGLGMDDRVVTLKLALAGAGATCSLDRVALWAVPEPSTLGLVVAAGLALMWRKAR